MKKIRVLSLIFVCLFLFAACSSAAKETALGDNYNGVTAEGSLSGSDKDYSYDSSMDAIPQEPGSSVDSSTGSGADTDSLLYERKLIKNGSFTIETLEYENTVSAIEQLVASSGGYIQDSKVNGTGAVSYGNSIQLRRATYTIRIPADGFGGFEEALASCGSILSRSVNVNEVSDYYYDSEARLKSLQAQEEQLLALLEKADYLDVIVQLQSELSNVRYQIESLQGTLRRLDNQIAFSTVTVYVNEVSQPTVIKEAPKTLGQRISYTFSNTWYNITESAKDFAVFFLGNIIIIAIWLIIIVAAILIIRHYVKRNKKKTSSKEESNN